MKTKQKVSKKYQNYSDFEKAAMKERIQELNKDNGENAVLEKIAQMPEPDRSMAKRIHELILKNATSLSPKTWYGMPAYANKEGKVVCFFQNAAKFKYRYSTLGFQDTAKLDEGNVWPISFALKKLTAADEAKIIALVKKAVR